MRRTVSKHSRASHAALCSSQEQTNHSSTSDFFCLAKGTIGALIKKNGGKHSTKVSGEGESWRVTHLITTAKHIEVQTEKGEV